MAEVERFREIDSENDRNRIFFSLALNKTSRHKEPFIVKLSPSHAGIGKPKNLPDRDVHHWRIREKNKRTSRFFSP